MEGLPFGVWAYWTKGTIAVRMRVIVRSLPQGQQKKEGCVCIRGESKTVTELKAQLRQTHTTKYLSVQYALWAEMIVEGTHESTDEPPSVPMFGSRRPRGRPTSGNLSETLTDVADKFASALSPTTSSTCRSSGSYSSPSKPAELPGKYMQQLKELVTLHDIDALTDEEYDEQRLVIVNLMRKLSS